MKKTPRGSNLPIPKASKGSPNNAKSTLSKGGPHTRSAEDIPRRVQLSVAGGVSPQRRAISPGEGQRRSLLPVSPSASGQSGVRYITEDLLRKVSREDNLEMVTTVNLTLTRGESGKKIKYIENLEKLKKVQVLNLSNNIIEKIERLDKLLKLKELNLSDNAIVKIEGLEHLLSLQVLNLNGNLIEHIPIWMGKRLRSLRSFHVSRNRLESLSELAKLKPLPDLTQLSVAENPLAEFNHCRSYLIFHLRTLEIVDGQPVNDRERTSAKERFEQDEMEKLERQLEGEEAKYRRLEEDHNRSKQERSHLSATEEDLRRREKSYAERLEELERELQTKNDLLKKKTSELNKACEKHYQLEQELAFHKIDSKFDSLGRGPEQSLDETGDESGLLGESPYIGRARYKPNKFAQESNILAASPSRVSVQSVQGPVRADVKLEMAAKLDNEIAEKQSKVSKAEDRLKRLSEELRMTEDKLRNATKDLRGIGEDSMREKEEQKHAIRQKLARKMRTVNEMKDSATQIEEERDKTTKQLHQNKIELNQLKDRLGRMSNTDPNYRRVYGEMVDKEQQINESNQMYNQLQTQLELMLDTVAKETSDIKKLEQQLNEDQVENNESMREELEEIVGGLQSYLAQVQTKAAKKEREFDSLLKDNENLAGKVRKLETELGVLDAEAGGLKAAEQQLHQLEQSLHDQEDRNRQLQDQIHRSQRQDTQTADYLESREQEITNLKKALKDMEHKAKDPDFIRKHWSELSGSQDSLSQSEKQTLEKQLQTEKAKAIDGERKTKDAHKKDDEIRKLMSQLDTVKAQNVALRDKVEMETQTLQARLQDTTPNTDLKRRLRDLVHTFKQGKTNIEPENEKDVIGKTFRELQGFVQDKFNKSSKDLDQSRSRIDKSDQENQSLREQLKRLDDKLNKRDEKVKNDKKKAKDEVKTNLEEIKRLNDEVQRLRNALKEAKNRQGKTKMVHKPDSDSEFSRRSSLNSEEKFLFDELQDELMTLKKTMRGKEEETNKKLIDAEAEAAMLEQNLQEQEESYQNEIRKLKDHMEMQRERQEARAQVIAADLDQAQQVADFLQRMLDEREHQLHSEVQQSDMNNNMIATQEDELSKLYDILETQKGELDRLNNMLDSISAQGGSLGTAGADDELWRLRQEVNNLKETLAMQSAYVQTMPPPALSAGVQANTGTGTQYYLTDPGTAAGPTYRPLLSQYKEQPMSVVPPQVARNTMGTSYAPPGYMSQGVGGGVASGVGFSGLGVGGVGVGGVSMGVGGGMPMDAGMVDPNITGGTDAREVKTPPGGRPSMGRSRPSQSPLRKHADRGADADYNDGQSERSRRSGRSGRSGRSSRRKDGGRGHVNEEIGQETQQKLGFEPVHRPQPQHPLMTSMPGGVGPGQGAGTAQMAGVPMGGQMSGPGMMIQPGAQGPGVPAGALAGTLPLTQSQGALGTRGYDGVSLSPTRAPVGMGSQMAPGASILKHPGINLGGQGTGHGHMIPPGYTIPPPPGANMGPAGSGVPQMTGSQHAGIGITQTPGHAGNQTSGFATVPTHPLGPSVVMGAEHGQGIGQSAFTAPAQPVAYDSGRVFLPAYPTSPSRPAARVYYTGGNGGPGGGGGGGGGGAPYSTGVYGEGPPSPSHNVKFLPVEPLAQGTPITGHSKPRTSNTVPMPSPIRSVNRDQSPVRANMAATATAGDDTYLFCNVPEHHDLEDYIAELQEKLKKLKARIVNEKEVQAEMAEKEDYNLIRRLQGELSERRDELEGLDLAIERQQKNLRNLKSEEKRLQFEREAAHEDLAFEKEHNSKRRRPCRVYPDDEDSFDERMENSRKKMLKDEIKCLEHTLAKRKSQLREADRLLKECNTDLKCARDEARDTVREYDKAAVGLENTVKETGELEKRANLAGLELIKATEKLSVLRRDTKDYEGRRGKQEKLLRDVTQLITKRDAEFKDLDNRTRGTQQNLTRLQSELNTTAQKERDMITALRDSEDVLAKRRNEITRLRDQIDQSKHELEKIDHQMGKKRTELQFLTDNVDRKQAEIKQLIQQTESELSANKRDIKEQRDLLRNLELQRTDLDGQLKSKRTSLQKIKDEIDTDDEILQKLVNTVNKHKSDLKHTFEMQRLEQTELDNLKSQHAQKLSELEQTQRNLLDEKNALEQLNSDVNKKTSELERLRNCIERDRADGERLAMEKQSYEDRISTMSREKEMLDEAVKTLDTKVAHMRRSQGTMEEKIDSTSRRLETLEQEMHRRERELEDLDRQKAQQHKEMHNLKNNVKDGKNELKILKDHIRDAENKIKHMEQDLRDTSLQRDEAKLEMERLNEGIRQSRLTHDDCLRQQKQREEELQDLIRTMDEREIEYQETRKALNKVRKEVEKEEGKLSKLVSTASVELDSIQTDLNQKQSELTQATTDIFNLKKEAEKMELDEHKLTECEHQIRGLKQEVQDRNEEKKELAKALTHSYEELQKLRTESAQEQERLTLERMQLENTLRDLQDQLEHAKKEMQQMQKRSNSQVQELQSLAEEQFSRANKLSDEINKLKVKKVADQSQGTLSDVTNQNTVSDPLTNQNTVSDPPDKPPTPIEELKRSDSSITRPHDGHMTRSHDSHMTIPHDSHMTIHHDDRIIRHNESHLTKSHNKQHGSYDQLLNASSHMKRSHDRGSYPMAEAVSKIETSFRDYLDLAVPVSPLRDAGSSVLDSKLNDTSLSWPESTGSGNVSPRKHDTKRESGSYMPGREKPSCATAPTPDGQKPDPFSLTECSPDSFGRVLKAGVDISNKVPLIPFLDPTPCITDYSSTISSPTLTQRDPLTPRPDPTGKPFYGGKLSRSPPVRDGGYSALDLPFVDVGHYHDHDRDRRLSFDLGFLDILTIDSNSSVVDQCSTGRLTDRQADNKENMNMNIAEESRKIESTRDKLAREQEMLRKQLQSQMQRHAEAMEQARLQSEGTIDSLRKKLNTLQDVLVTTPDLSSPTMNRARSRSAGLVPSPERQRSPSPGMRYRGYQAQRPRSRSRSADRIINKYLPERDTLTV